MKVRWGLFILMGLAGCVPAPPQNIVHRTGSTRAERLAAFDKCDFAAIQAIPRAMATNISGGYRSPGTLQCSTLNGLTTCNRIGAVNIPPSATTYDANTEIRSRYINRCLEAAGYEVLSRPVCSTPAQVAAMRATENHQPPARAISCALPSR